jgi:asparagine synthase (glutamine-hydrolysing)
MAHSLELRVPLVDATLRSALLGADFEPARSEGKAQLARTVAPELPTALWSRPKTGFSIPVMRWVDEQAGLAARPGAASRRLALRVLEHHGIAPAEAEGS